RPALLPPVEHPAAVVQLAGDVGVPRKVGDGPLEEALGELRVEHHVPVGVELGDLAFGENWGVPLGERDQFAEAGELLEGAGEGGGGLGGGAGGGGAARGGAGGPRDPRWGDLWESLGFPPPIPAAAASCQRRTARRTSWPYLARLWSQ